MYTILKIGSTHDAFAPPLACCSPLVLPFQVCRRNTCVCNQQLPCPQILLATPSTHTCRYSATIELKSVGVIEVPVKQGLGNQGCTVHTCIYVPKTITPIHQIRDDFVVKVSSLAVLIFCLLGLQNPEDSELKSESMDIQVSPTHQSFAPPASPLTRPLSHQVSHMTLPHGHSTQLIY